MTTLICPGSAPYTPSAGPRRGEESTLTDLRGVQECPLIRLAILVILATSRPIPAPVLWGG